MPLMPIGEVHDLSPRRIGGRELDSYLGILVAEIVVRNNTHYVRFVFNVPSHRGYTVEQWIPLSFILGYDKHALAALTRDTEK